MTVQTDREKYKHRFALGHDCPEGKDPREELYLSIRPETPVDEIWGTEEEAQKDCDGILAMIAGTATLEDVFGDGKIYRPMPNWKQFEETRLAFLHSSVPQALRQSIIKAWQPSLDQFWNPLMMSTRNPSDILVKHLMLHEWNMAPTSESRVNHTYCFWVRALCKNMLSRFVDWDIQVEVYEMLYQVYLDAINNRILPGKAREQNLPREGFEILGPGRQIVLSDEQLNSISDIYVGLANGKFRPDWQPEGPFFLEVGNYQHTFEQVLGTPNALIEYITWKSLMKETAEYQIWRWLWPLLGANLTPRLHAKLINVWQTTDGSRYEVLRAAIDDDDAWGDMRGTPVQNMVNKAKYYNLNNMDYDPKRAAITWMSDLGIRPEQAPDAIGRERSLIVATAPFIIKRMNLPGTPEQLQAATAPEALFV